MGCGASVEASMPNKETLSSTSQVPQEESVAQQQEKEANNVIGSSPAISVSGAVQVREAATAQAPRAVEVRTPEGASGDQAAQGAAAAGDDDEDDDVPLYDPRFRRLSRADCDSHRESLLHDLAERHARRPSIQFALDENEVTEIPYDESAQKQEDNNNEEDDEDDDDEESSGSEGAPEELPAPTGKRSSQGDTSRRRSSLEMCAIESKAEHDLREREIAHRRSLQKAAEDGEAHVGFAVKVDVATYEVPLAAPASGTAGA